LRRNWRNWTTCSTGTSTAHYETRSWNDRENRQFFVRLSAWSRSSP
jgi:hypothetical protein